MEFLLNIDPENVPAIMMAMGGIIILVLIYIGLPSGDSAYMRESRKVKIKPERDKKERPFLRIVK